MTDEIRILTTATVFEKDPLPHLKGDKGFGTTLADGTIAQVILDEVNGGIVLHMKPLRGPFQAVHVALTPLLEAVCARARDPRASIRSSMPSVAAPALPTLDRPRYGA